MSITADRLVRGRTNERIFFTGMALAAAAAVFLGFAPTYFVRLSTLPPLTWLYELHGAVFTTWIALFIVQTSLVAANRTDLHRRLGIAGVVVAGLVFILGIAVSIETLRRGGGGRDPRVFLSIPLGDIIAFGVLVTAAVVLRRRLQAHKRLMLLATISVLTAAVGRSMVQLHIASPVTLFLGTDIFIAAVVLYDVMSRGRVHPATLFGAAMVGVFKPVLYALSGTPVWLAFADALR